MSFFRRLASVFSPKSGGGLSQRTIDGYRASLLLSSYALSKSNGMRQPTQEQVDRIFRDVQTWNFEDFANFSQDELNKQILDMFGAIEAQSIGGPPMVQGLGFTLERRQSSLANAGEGVFVSIPPNSSLQAIPAGTLVALFGGNVHLTEFTSQKEYVQQNLLPDPDMQCLVRVDEPIVIDGRTTSSCPPNPLALGHLVNHCGTTKPNVLQHPYNFPLDPLELDPAQSFPKQLRRHIPNIYHKKPTLLGSPDRSALMHSAVLIAAQPLEHGAELLMDYRLRPSGNLPVWYQHYDLEQSEARWR